MTGQTPGQSSLLGKRLGHYRIAERIGAGGMGEVYRAHDEHLERDVAIKVLPAGTLGDEAARKRFRTEALALSRINHPNIATVFDFDTQQGIDFLVTELIPGVTLDATFTAGPLAEKDVLLLGMQLAEGLEGAHRQGVVHRDLKPANLRITPDGRLKILDFGLATLLHSGDDASLTQSVNEAQGIAGTLPYMAPEQLRGKPADARSDIYAAGAVLYEMATRSRPFEQTLPAALVTDIVQKPPPPPARLNPTISPKLEDIILRCLEKEPDTRYQSAKDLLVDLRRLASAGTTTSFATPIIRKRRSWILVAAPVAVVLLATVLAFTVGGLRPRWFSPAPPPKIESLAVLPLTNLSGDPQQEYFADGMTDELITTLSQINGLKVISRTSVMQYKGVKKPLPAIARELNVDGIVEGTVLKADNRVRITAQLIQAATDRNLWARSYERDLQDVLAMQSDVARAIAGEIKLNLNPEEQSRLARAQSVDPEAHEAYLKGRYYANQRTTSALNTSISYFQQAIARVPTYALAYSGLADAYALLGFRGNVPSKDALAQAKAAALKAIALDDTLPGPHASLAFIAETYEWDWATAEREYRRALELDPGDARAHNWYAGYLIYVRRIDEGLSEARRARDLDPLSLPVLNALAGRLLVAGRVGEALEQLHRILEMNPNFAAAHQTLGWAYLNQGKNEDAVQEFQRALQFSPNDTDFMVDLGFADAVAGRRNEAEKILSTLKTRHAQGQLPSGAIAILYGALGERDQAFPWLERAYQEHDPELTYLQVPNRRFAPLRSDPRFQSFVRRMNFPPSASHPAIAAN
jgi:serine/threonine protein kinase/tetratricopeptide (TPR) repeat protein